MTGRIAATVVVILLVLGAVSVSRSYAELTQEEAESILHAREAALKISRGLRDHVAYLMNAHTSPSTRPVLGAAMQQGNMASLEANQAIAVLLNVIPMDASSSAHASFAALPRSERVQYAWLRLDRAIMYAQQARNTLTAAKNLKRQDRQYQDWVARASDMLRGAIDHLGSVDRGLAYADPNPTSFPQVVGPHGDFAGSERMLWLAQAYGNDAVNDLAAAYLATSLTTGSGHVFRRLLDATDTVLNSMVLLAGVTWTEKQASESPFFRTLDVLQALTDRSRLPGKWAQAIFELHPWRASSASEAAALVTDRITDAWMHSDDAAWRLMVFLDCSKLKNARGCGGR